MPKTLDPTTFQADHHTDIWIAQNVMGWPSIKEIEPFVDYLHYGGVVIGNHRPTIFRFGTIPDVFMPSSKVEDAKEVQRKMKGLGWDCMISELANEDNVMVIFSKSHQSTETIATAETESLAICRAAGLAVIGEKK